MNEIIKIHRRESARLQAGSLKHQEYGQISSEFVLLK
jgi:hypothetical protein